MQCGQHFCIYKILSKFPERNTVAEQKANQGAQQFQYAAAETFFYGVSHNWEDIPKEGMLQHFFLFIHSF